MIHDARYELQQVARRLLICVCLCIGFADVYAQPEPADAQFPWPGGRHAAVSLTFDDARFSQVDGGTDLLDKYGARATFYVVPATAEKRLEGWKKAVASGHEIGNHSLVHPCSGNFLFSRDRALETYTLEQMQEELLAANARIEELLGVTPTSFAYPCGMSYVGRGRETKSYVPVVATLFTSGRGWLDEAPNDPTYVDLSQVMGMEMDGKDFDAVLPMLEQARADGLWLVLAGHEMNEAGRQTTRLSMLEDLIPYLQDPANGFWLATVREVTAYIESRRHEEMPTGNRR
jgi:peptidoglycan/xylan/chitin deacetylase (PgdA/CDA1 family)